MYDGSNNPFPHDGEEKKDIIVQDMDVIVMKKIMTIIQVAVQQVAAVMEQQYF